MTQNERIEKLKAFLELDPKDSFLLFAMAMELKSQQHLNEALDYLDRVLAIDPDVTAAYFHKAQILIHLSRRDEAKNILQAGIPRALGTGHFHARDKMKELLEQLEAE